MGYGASTKLVAHIRDSWRSIRSSRRPARSRATAALENLESRLLLSSDPVVAVLDTGVNITDPNIAPYLYVNPKENLTIVGDNDVNGFANDLYGWDFVNNTSIITDLSGHGTNVAEAVIQAAGQAAAAAGIANNVKIMPIVVMTAMSPLGSTGVTGLGGAWTFNATSGLGTYRQAGLGGSTWTWSGPGTTLGPTPNALGDWTWTGVGPAPVTQSWTTPPVGTPGSANWIFNSTTRTWSFDATTDPTYVAPTMFTTWASTGQPTGRYGAPGSPWSWFGPGVGSPPTSTLGTWAWTGQSMPAPGSWSPTGNTPAAGPGTGSFVWDVTTASWSWVPQASGAGTGGTSVGNAMGIGGTIQNLVDGMNYVILMKNIGRANVVAMNIAVGGWYTNTPDADPVLWPIKDAIRRAGNAGIVVTIGAGNGGNNNDITANYPANFSNGYLVSTAAVDNNSALGTFSNYGPTTVKLAGLGVDVTVPSSATAVSGTEFASAQVAGTIAGMAEVNPGASSGDRLNALYSSLDIVPALATKTSTSGVVNASRAGIAIRGNRAPTGSLDVASISRVSGWAYDVDTPTSAISVQVYIDGALFTTNSANQYRADLTSVIGSANHGFSVDLSGLTTGTHTVAVYMLDTSTNQRTLLGSRSVSNRPATGWVDTANATAVTGWAADLDDPNSPVYVRVDVDGVAGAPFLATNSRSDLTPVVGNPAHGFSYALPALAPGFHRIDVTAYDTATGDAQLLASRTINTNTPPIGWIDVANASMIKGWALDPDLGNAPLNIRVDIDGVPYGVPVGGLAPQIVANESRPDVGAVYGTSDHGFTFNLPQLSAGSHSIAVYAIDPDTLQLVNLPLPQTNSQITVTDYAFDRLPTGFVDSITTSGVSGWAFDAESGPQAVSVRVDVDGSTVANAVADQLRVDVGAAVGSPNHGFSVALPALTAGPHRIEVYYINPQTATPVLMVARLLPKQAPTGFVDVLNSEQIAGWAYAPDTPTSAIQIRVDIDGMVGPLVTANRTRVDLGAVIGSADHGFALTTPKLSTGRHVITVKAIDPFTLDAVTLGSGVLTV